MSYYSNVKAQSVQRLRDTEVVIAVRHHKRALTYLQTISFNQLPTATTQKLVEDLSSGLSLLESELKRRELPLYMVESGQEQHV